ncbi:interleukin-13 receptor subunit alpha-1-like [Larimichthys crocea]|uniref:interleukin-13 receptor subunit alpha-1-like n=1 Tax=Larimichthys crocea TaxID=215358 RepID=UPI000F60173F|nr:interleukin-13 receptor subunit alpha-1-like [Larimichthys crocea]XP_019128990.2 interleukin-13 receptor subunit alpha-1-like [Larimichthys crocea]
MSVIRGLFVSVTLSALIMALHCKADQYPQQWNLTYKWLDRFTVNISWKKPIGLADDSGIKYCMKNIEDDNDEVRVNDKLEIIKTLLTEEKRTDSWTYHIWTIGDNSSQSNESVPAMYTIRTLKPRDEVVKDFKCFAITDKMNCSWIPANRSQNLVLSYRIIGRTQEEIQKLNKCDETYSNGERDGCYLHIEPKPQNIFVLVETDTAMMTFIPKIDLLPPRLSLKEEGVHLKLSWNASEFKKMCRESEYQYEVCYSECNEWSPCQKTSPGKSSMEIIYNKNCQYEFKSRVMTTEYCFSLSSTFAEPVIYGTNKTPDETLTVVAIFIPIILSACIILSCYCFRRYRAIICPVIPDPSAIFKEMIMNGNSDHKATQTKLYTPVPEPIEPCKITLVSENSPMQQNY